MAKLFGTDGIRGRANQGSLAPSQLVKIGRALGATLIGSGAPKRVLVGRDTRRSGPMVGSAIVAGLLSSGVDAAVAGVLPTPAVARLTMAGRYGLGIVISASHNPAHDNGVKVFLRNGRKPDPEFAEEVESRTDTGPCPGGEKTGRYRALHDATNAYLDVLMKDFNGLDLAGVRVAVDCANGATSTAGPQALERLGADVVAVAAKPNGTNINRRCGSTWPKTIQRAVVDAKADVGIAFDGDGDRVIFADETGAVVDGDATMAILARDLKARRRLPRDTVAATVMSNLGLEQSLKSIGARLVRTPVGDRYVVEEMDRGGFSLGGEQSGHLIVRRGKRMVGDGLETALHLLAARQRAGDPLSRLGGCFVRAPQRLINIPVRERPPLEELPEVSDAVRKAKEDLADEGRVVVRYSGTEPVARVMVEAIDPERMAAAAEGIAAIIRREIGSES
ncbi:MAG: phosphoglucosamine mutase [Planctomycetota bacterium]